MKQIIQIAVAETRRFFYSPIIWVLLAMFLLLVAYYHSLNFIRFAEYQERNETGQWSALTQRMFSITGGYGLFRILLSSSFLFIPLITMSTFSPDYSTGSIKLLQTSPVKGYQIVLGKYTALLFYALLLCLVLVLLTFICSWFIPNYEFTYFFSGLLGFFLLASAFLSIGLFISSLTPSVIIAGAVTFSVLGVMEILGSVGQNIPILNKVLYWISFTDRAKQMMHGLVSSKNVIYFLLIGVFFVVITVIRLDAFKNGWFSRFNIIRGVFLLVGLVVVALFSTNPYNIFYKDFRKGHKNTVSVETQELASQLRAEPLVFNTYVNVMNAFLNKSYLPARRNKDKDRFEEYIRFLPNWQFNYYYYYDTLPENTLLYNRNSGLSTRQIAYKLASVYGIPKEDLLSANELEKIVDLGGESSGYTRELNYDGKRAFVRMYTDDWHYPHEREVQAALRNLVDDPITIGIVQGHQERSLANTNEDYYLFLAAREDNRFSLRNEGFSLVTVRLDDIKALDNIDILIIADPKIPLEQSELASLKRYVDSGRNMIVAAEPANAAHINPVLSIFGLTQQTDALPSGGLRLNEDLIMADVDSAFYNHEVSQYYRMSRSRQHPPKAFLQTAGCLEGVGTGQFSTQPLLSVATNSTNLDSLAQSSDKGKRIIACTLEREIGNKTQKILAIADADFLSNKQYSRRVPGLDNRGAFLLPLFDWLSDKVKTVVKVDNPDDKLFLSIKEAKQFRVVLLYVLPALFVLSGAALLIFRRMR